MVPCLIVAATAVSYALGWLIRSPALTPVLNTVAAFPFMVASLRRNRSGQAIARMLVWAAAMAVCATVLSYWRTLDAERLFVNAPAYRHEMFAWVLTGTGRESDPARFIPQHLVHGALFCVLSILTGSVLSMPAGAVLVNSMGYYVGALAAASERPFVTALLAWPPWSLVRVISFVILGVVLAGPVLSRVGGFAFRWQAHRRLVLLACAGLVIDIVMKWALAPVWRVFLTQAVGW